MGRTTSSARQRGSSAGKARRSTNTEQGSKCNDAQTTSPSSTTAEAYEALLRKYDGLPEKLRHKLAQAALNGRAFSLHLSDIAPPNALKFQVTGELYDEIQAELDALGDYTSLSLMRVLMKCRKLPMGTRFEVAKEMLPYEHARNPEPADNGNTKRPTMMIPIMSIEDWEREAEKHRERSKKMEEELGNE